MTEEIQISLPSKAEAAVIETILQIGAEAIRLRDSAAETGNQAVLKARECGVYLAKAKEMCGEGKWTAWHSAHVRSLISYDTADRYIKLSKVPVEDLKKALSLRKAYIQAGILPDSQGHDSNNKTLPGGCVWLELLDKTWAEVKKLEKTLGTMSEGQVNSLKLKLKPLAELYATL